MSKEIVFDFVYPMSISVSGNGICKLWLILSKVSRNCQQWNRVLFVNFHFCLENITLLCLQIAKLKQHDCKRLFVGAFANTCYSMLGLGIVKNVVVNLTIYLFLYFFVKGIQFEQSGKFIFERHQLFLFSTFCNLILSVMQQWKRCERVEDFALPALSTLKTLLLRPNRFRYAFSSNWIWSCGLVVKKFTGSLGPYQELRWQFTESEAFNFYTTHSEQKSFFAPFRDVFLIDSLDQDKQETN